MQSTKRPQEREKGPNGHCIAKQAGRTRRTMSNNKKKLIYWRDSVTPVGPLALLYARIHHSIHPPPNGDVRVTTPKLSTSERKLMAAVMRFKPADVTEMGSIRGGAAGAGSMGMRVVGVVLASADQAGLDATSPGSGSMGTGLVGTEAARLGSLGALIAVVYACGATSPFGEVTVGLVGT